MIEDFITYLTAVRGYSTHTATAYEKDIRKFACWMKRRNHEARWSTITREDLDEYITQEYAAGLAPATTNRHLSSISSLYDYMKRQGYEVVNPCRYESRRKIGARVPNTIPTEDIIKAYQQSEGTVHIILGILASTGMRIQELLDMEWQDIDHESGTIRVHGKGCKERIVHTSFSLLEELQQLAHQQYPSGKIFHYDQRTARYMIWRALQSFSNARQLSPHAIRHTMATNMANHGTNATTIAAVLGHNDIRTTQKYIDMTQAATRRAMRRYSLIN